MKKSLFLLILSCSFPITMTLAIAADAPDSMLSMMESYRLNRTPNHISSESSPIKTTAVDASIENSGPVQRSPSSVRPAQPITGLTSLITRYREIVFVRSIPSLGSAAWTAEDLKKAKLYAPSDKEFKLLSGQTTSSFDPPSVTVIEQ